MNGYSKNYFPPLSVCWYEVLVERIKQARSCPEKNEGYCFAAAIARMCYETNRAIEIVAGRS